MTTSSQPALGAIRLAWWREALERLDKSQVPPEPRLQAAASELLQRGVSGQLLAGLEDGWATLLDEAPDVERVAQRGGRLFAIGATLLGASDPLLDWAGRLYAIEIARRLRLAPVLEPRDEFDRLAGHRFPRRLRPMTAFARLAARDVRQAPAIEPEATPGRAAALLSHRLFGTVA